MKFSAIPARSGEGPEVQNMRGEGGSAAGPGRHRPLVMMVEDNAHDRELYGMILCYNGFDVVLARQGTSALRLAQQYRPDLVLLDLGLPDMSGLEVCSALRRSQRTRDTPVVALSGFLENSMGPRAQAAGCTVYLEKPTQPLKVLARIEALIGRPPQAGVGQAPQLLDPEAGPM